MITFEEITATAPRTRYHYSRHVFLPNLNTHPVFSPEYWACEEEFGWMCSCSVHMDDKPKVVGLAKKLEAALIADLNHPDISRLIAEIKSYRLKPSSEYTAEDTWRENAFALSTYSGPRDVVSRIVKYLRRYRGNVLEALCGHTTYFQPQEGVIVTALDGCRESLERYPEPTRRRIVCDLDQLEHDGDLPFESNSFDAISICFGHKYPKFFEQLLRAFRKILKPGGKLGFIENPSSEYSKYTHRAFLPELAGEPLISEGFKDVKVKRLRFSPKVWNPGNPLNHFYHLEGTNP